MKPCTRWNTAGVGEGVETGGGQGVGLWGCV